MNQIKSKGKEISGYISLCLPAKKATPGPPVGPAFGQKGVSGAEFTKQFNDATKKYDDGTPVRVLVTVYSNRTFTFVLLGTPVSFYLKQYAKVEKGSSKPGRSSAGTITEEEIQTIAGIKMKDGLSARKIERAMKIVEGSARSMGLKIIKNQTENDPIKDLA